MPSAPTGAAPPGPAGPAEAGRRNASAIVRTLLAHGPLPRHRIAELTGLSAGTVTRLTGRLAAADALSELPSVLGPGESGRPRVPLDVPAGAAVVGAHLGLLRTTVGLTDLRGTVLAERVLPHASTDPRHLVSELRSSVHDLIDSQAASRVLGVGVSTGGWVDTATGTVVEHGPLGWHGVPLLAELARRLGRPVRLDGQVRAHALAETWYGAGRHADSLVELFVGNVVGAAFTVGRRIHHGPRSAAGTVEHLRLPDAAPGAPCHAGHTDCLHALLADSSILRLARRDGLVGPHDTHEELVRRAAGGSTGAAELLRTRARHLGRAAALLLDLLNPELLVAAGGPLLAPHYLADARGELARHSSLGAQAADRLVPSTLGPHSLVLSSAAVFLDAWLADPLAPAGKVTA